MLQCWADLRKVQQSSCVQVEGTAVVHALMCSMTADHEQMADSGGLQNWPKDKKKYLKFDITERIFVVNNKHLLV